MLASDEKSRLPIVLFACVQVVSPGTGFFSSGMVGMVDGIYPVRDLPPSLLTEMPVLSDECQEAHTLFLYVKTQLCSISNASLSYSSRIMGFSS